MIRKTIYILVVALLVKNSNAQQDALYSQYMFNPFAINPAYAGSRDALSTVLLFRQQWVGIEGAPSTQTLSMHGPLNKGKMALGFNVVNDVVGPTKNTGSMLTYAYILKLRKAKLSFALRGGVFHSRLDQNLLSYGDPSDRFANTGTVSTLVPTFDFGTYLYSNNLYAGFSVNHLLENTINYSTLPDDAYVVMKRHYMLGFGGAFQIGKNTIFKPSTLIKYVSNAPVNFDINASFLFNKVFWLGASYRSSKGIVLISEYNITDFLRIGYSYDIVLSQLKRFTSGTHEIMLGLDLNMKKTKSISPRYL